VTVAEKLMLEELGHKAWQDCMVLKTKGLRSFGKSGTTWPTT